MRSIAHEFADHGGGHKRFLTGRDPAQPTGFVNDYPMVGSMVAKVRGQRPGGVPNYVAGADGGREQIDVFSFGSAYLGAVTSSVHGGRRSERSPIPGPELAPLADRRTASTTASSCSTRLDHDPAMPSTHRHDGSMVRSQPRPASADDRHGPPGVRPVAASRPRARPLRHAPLGPAA